jgi:hypothetical protein
MDVVEDRPLRVTPSKQPASRNSDYFAVTQN